MLSRSEKYKYKIIQYRSEIPKPKKNEIVIIPTDNRLMDTAPYLVSQKLPSWWKDLPKSKFSLRRCQGTYDYITSGFIVPLWCDITIRPSISGKLLDYKTNNYDDNVSFRIEQFTKESAEGCPISKYNKIQTAQFPKIVSPWRFFTPKGVSLLSLPVYHEPNENYTIMPGMVHTDFYNQIHIVLNVLTDKEFTIPAGTPIQHLVPFHRNFDIKNIVFGNESMARFVNGTGMGLGSLSVPDESHLYRKMQWEKEEQFEKEYNESLFTKFKNIF